MKLFQRTVSLFSSLSPQVPEIASEISGLTRERARSRATRARACAGVGVPAAAAGPRDRSREGAVVGRQDDGAVVTPGDAEGRDEDVHQADEVEQVGGAVLPEGPLPVHNPLLPVDGEQ